MSKQCSAGICNKERVSRAMAAWRRLLSTCQYVSTRRQSTNSQAARREERRTGSICTEQCLERWGGGWWPKHAVFCFFWGRIEYYRRITYPTTPFTNNNALYLSTISLPLPAQLEVLLVVGVGDQFGGDGLSRQIDRHHSAPCGRWGLSGGLGCPAAFDPGWGLHWVRTVDGASVESDPGHSLFLTSRVGLHVATFGSALVLSLGLDELLFFLVQAFNDTVFLSSRSVLPDRRVKLAVVDPQSVRVKNAALFSLGLVGRRVGGGGRRGRTAVLSRLRLVEYGGFGGLEHLI